MYKVKRTIYVDNQSIDVWFGLVSKTKNGKNGKYTVKNMNSGEQQQLASEDLIAWVK